MGNDIHVASTRFTARQGLCAVVCDLQKRLWKNSPFNNYAM
jgi:hypothetical protein